MSPDLHGDIEQKLRSLLEGRLEGLSRRVEEWVEEARREPLSLEVELVPAAAGESETLRELADFAREVESSADLGRILSRLVSGAAGVASRVVLFAVRGDSLAGWAARGVDPDLNPRSICVSASADNLLRQACATCGVARETPADRPGNEALSSVLGGESAPMEMMAAPLWVRDRVVAVLYADGAEDSVWQPEAISVMTSLAALSLEALASRTKFPRPAAPPAGRAVVPPEPKASSSDEERARNDARRFARLLVSEILLYNDKQVQEGRRNKDLYQRLKEEIDRSRRMYEQRTSQRIPRATDYFREELVEMLAGGDESALSLPWV